MLISELEKVANVSAKTIRYYESVGVLPPPERLDNGYRQYQQTDINRLKLVAGARRLDISLEEIKEILDMRDRRDAPCLTLLELLKEKANEIELRIQELKQLEEDIKQLYQLGLTFPTNDVEGKNCVCHLVSERQNINNEEVKK